MLCQLRYLTFGCIRPTFKSVCFFVLLRAEYMYFAYFFSCVHHTNLRTHSAAGSDPSSVVQNFLQSLQSNNSQQETTESPYTTLADLLSTPSTLPFLESADESTLNQLLSSLPESLQLLSKQNNNAPVERINVDKKRNALRKVLRSPQFAQSLGSLTMAIRDGGLPSISDALKIPVQNGGFMRRGGVPLGGGEAVKAFVEGVRQQVEDNQKGDSMETD